MTAIPRELRERPQWVCWRYEARDGEQTKVPYNAKTARKASSTAPHTWCDYETACRAASAYDGIGYVFAKDDPFVGVDLDDCIDTNGGMAGWARAILHALHSYTEISPSGNGVKIFVAGELAEAVKCIPYQTGGIEIYPHGRYFTVTGQHLDGTPTTIQHVNGALTTLVDDVKAERARQRKQRYLDKAIARELDDLTSAAEGNRNTQLYASARALRRFVESGDITEADARRWLEDAAAETGLGTEEIRRTMDSAWTSSVTAFQMPPPNEGSRTRRVDPATGEISGAHEPEPWQPPIPFDSHVVPPFPTNVLPDWLRAFVEAEAISTQTPPDLAGMLAFAVLATTCQKQVEMCIKPGWTEPLSLYTVIAMPPGSRKSAVFRDLTAPLTAWEQAEAQRLDPVIAAAKSEHAILERRLEAAQKEASKGGDDATLRTMMQAAAEAAQALDAHTIPVLSRLVADDVTPEKLASLMAEQGGRMAVLSAEGTIFEIMAGRYTKNGAPNIDVFLKGHASDPLRVDRGTRSEFVERPALTLGLTVQPDVLQSLAEKRSFKGRGLLGRFLYAVPSSTLGTRSFDVPGVPEHVRAAYALHVTQLLHLPSGTDQDGNPAPHVLTLDPQARATFAAFVDHLEPQLGGDGAMESMTDWGGKLAGAIARIAGLLHLATRAHMANPWEAPVHGDTMQAAVSLAPYLIAHAQAAYSEMQVDPALADAEHLWRWLSARGVRTITRRDLHQGVRGRVKRSAAMEPALKLLVEHGYLRPLVENLRTRGRPSEVYEINPSAQYPQYSQKSSGGVQDAADTGHATYAHNSQNAQNAQNAQKPTAPVPDFCEYCERTLAFCVCAGGDNDTALECGTSERAAIFEDIEDIVHTCDDDEGWL